jgi:hypothetical protein
MAVPLMATCNSKVQISNGANKKCSMNFLKNELTAQARNPKLLLGRGWLWVERQKKTLGEHAAQCRTKPQLHGSLSLPYRRTQQTQARGQEGAATRESHRERQPRLGL